MFVACRKSTSAVFASLDYTGAGACADQGDPYRARQSAALTAHAAPQKWPPLAPGTKSGPQGRGELLPPRVLMRRAGRASANAQKSI